MFYRVHIGMSGIQTHNVSGTDWIGSCKFNNHNTITTTLTPISPFPTKIHIQVKFLDLLEQVGMSPSHVLLTHSICKSPLVKLNPTLQLKLISVDVLETIVTFSGTSMSGQSWAQATK
jgi:hypothetical protein